MIYITIKQCMLKRMELSTFLSNLKQSKPLELPLYKLSPLLLLHTHLYKHPPEPECVWIKTAGRCPPISTPHPFPTDTFEAPLMQRGDVRLPPPRHLGSRGLVVYTLLYSVNTVGCDLGLHLLQTKETVIEADLWGCLLCLAVVERARVHRDTPLSLLGFPWLYEWADWLETPRLWTAHYVIQIMHVCLLYWAKETPFIATEWNVTNIGTLQTHPVLLL